MSQRAVHLAVDVGGTKIAGGFCSPEFESIAARCKCPTPKGDALGALIAVVNKLQEVAQAADCKVLSVGVGAPGVIDTTTGTVVSAGPTMPGWEGTAIAEAIREKCDIPVAVHNDVRLMALGEARFGAGADYNRVLFVSLGTGVGGAFVFDGALSPSPHATAGELRNIVAAGVDGVAQPIESVLSGPGIAAAYNRLAETNDDLVQIMRRYEAGEALARQVVEDSSFNGGRALGALASAVDVDAIILGGGVGTIGPAIWEPFAKGVRAGVLPPHADLPVIPAQLGTDAPLFGAAWYGATNATA